MITSAITTSMDGSLATSIINGTLKLSRTTYLASISNFPVTLLFFLKVMLPNVTNVFNGIQLYHLVFLIKFEA